MHGIDPSAAVPHGQKPRRSRWKVWLGGLAAVVGAAVFFSSKDKDVRNGAAGAAVIGAGLLMWGLADRSGHSGAKPVRHNDGKDPVVHRVVSSDKPDFAANIAKHPEIDRSAHIHDRKDLVGHVVVREGAHVAPCSIRADEEGPFFIGPGANVQDQVTMHALAGKKVSVHGKDWAIYIGPMSTIAHGALIHGPAYVGTASFVGFGSKVHNAIVGSRCFIGHGALVTDVEIPSGRRVPNGAQITTQAQADALPPATDEDLAFARHVAQTNQELAAAYNGRKSA